MASGIANPPPPSLCQHDPFQPGRLNTFSHHYTRRDMETRSAHHQDRKEKADKRPNGSQTKTSKPLQRPQNSRTTESPPSNVSNVTRDTDVSDPGSQYSDDGDGSASPSCSSGPQSIEISEDEDEGGVDTLQQRDRRFPPVMPTAERLTRGWSSAVQVPAANVLAERLMDHLPLVEAGKVDEEVALSSSPASQSVADSTASSEDELQDLWTRLQGQRKVIKELRIKMSDKRADIQSLRRRKDDADNAFMRIVRPHLVTSSRVPPLSEELIKKRFDEMQDIRNEYNFTESEYEMLEFELDREENELQITETRFFSLLYGATRGNHRDYDSVQPEDDSHAPPSRTSLLGITGERPADVHPLYRQLLDAVGDRELAREHHTELIMHRDAILYDLEMTAKRDAYARSQGGSSVMSEEELESLKEGIATMSTDEIKAKFGSSIREEDMDFLKEFDDEERAAREKLNETKREVDQLRNECIQQGVMRKNIPYHEEYTIFSDVGDPFPSENMTINHEGVPKKGDSLANPRFPILLSNPTHVLEPLTAKAALRVATKLPKDDPSRPQQVAESMKEFGIATLIEQATPENKSDYINRWLLHRLRISPLEVELLYSVFSTVLKIINLRHWQEDVLYFWPRDEANRPAHIFEGPVTTRDDLEIDDTDVTSLVNSIINLPSRAKSDRGDESRGRTGHPPHSAQSI